MPSDFCCGAECGLNGPGVIVAPSLGHWTEVGVTPPGSQSSIARLGGRAYHFGPTGSTSYLGRPASGTQRWHCFYVYFISHSDKNAAILRHSVAAGDSPGVIYWTDTQRIGPAVGSVAGAETWPVSLGKWYRIETLADVGTGTRSMKMRVCEASQIDPWADGGDTVLADATLAQAASTFTGWRIGAAAFTSPTFDVVIDDIRTGPTAGEYPVGPATIVPVSPIADGTHGFNAAGDFQYTTAGSNVALGATDTWSRLAGLLGETVNSFLRAAGAATGEYLEWQVNTPPMSAIVAVEIVTLHMGGGVTPTNPHKQTLRWRESGVDVDVLTDADFSEVGAVQHSKHMVLAPGGLALTPARVGAARFRWGSSWTAADIDSVPIIAGLLLEVAGTLTTPPAPPSTSTEQHPVHTFAGAGTYTVTLTVTDNQGATAVVSQEVTVPGSPTFTLGRAPLAITPRGLTVVGGAGVLSTLTLELREGGILRATRNLIPALIVDPGDPECPVTRYRVELTAQEKASVTNWAIVRWWVKAAGGTRAIRIRRFKGFIQ